MTQPYFIIANPRSGSSILRILLNHHSNTIFPPECGFIQWLYPKYKNWDLNKINEFIIDLSQTKKFEGWEMSLIDLSTYLHTSKPKTYQEACYYVYEFYGIKQGKQVKVWGDKNNYYIDYLNEINTIYPEAKYINLTRNPKDICVSYLNLQNVKDEVKYKPNVPTNVKDIANSIRSNQIKVNNFLSQIDPNKVYNISYEDLMISPQEELIKIGSFLGLDFTNVLSNFNSKIYFDEPEITLKWKEKTKGSIDISRINTYINHPQEEEIKKYF